MTRLVDAILRAQGYTTYRSPEGADGGADILAGAGPLGCGAPRLCVEVNSEASPIDRPTLDKLLGAVSKLGAHDGLFVFMRRLSHKCSEGTRGDVLPSSALDQKGPARCVVRSLRSTRRRAAS